MLDAITKSFEEVDRAKENDEDDPDALDEDDSNEQIKEGGNSNKNEENDKSIAMTVNCGVCSKIFEDIDLLESHIESEHGKNRDKIESKVNTFVPRKGGWKCNLCHKVLRTCRELKLHKSRKECSVLNEVSVEDENSEKIFDGSVSKPAAPGATTAAPLPAANQRVKNISNAAWQVSEARNWAAEFGYSSGEKEGPRPGGLLSAMRANFGGREESEEDEEEGEGRAEEERRLYGRDGRSHQQAVREPRVLSQASRQTRKRLELLTKQAQAIMREREKKKEKKNSVNNNKSRQTNTSKATNNNTQTEKNVTVADTVEQVDVDEEEDDLNAGISNEDDLLIPLSNGWVCEKIRGAAGGQSTVHYWSPDGEQFHSQEQISQFAARTNTDIDMQPFQAAELSLAESQTRQPGAAAVGGAGGVASVRVKDEQTGLPMVVIFPGGHDCLTMDVAATA